MKILLYVLLLAAAMHAASPVGAQTLKELIAQKKMEAIDKARAKAEAKASQGIDSAVNTPERVIRKKKEKKGNEEKETNNDFEASDDRTEAVPTTNAPTGGTANDRGEFVIKTNIKCAIGKTAVESSLQNLERVSSVMIDIKTGKIFLSAEGDTDTYKAALAVIRAEGFEADGKAATVKKKICNTIMK